MLFERFGLCFPCFIFCWDAWALFMDHVNGWQHHAMVLCYSNEVLWVQLWHFSNVIVHARSLV